MYETINENNHIVKANKLIESKGKLGVVEQKLMAMLISEIQMDDEDFKEYNLNINNMAKKTGMDKSNLYKVLKNASNNLLRKTIFIEDINENNKKVFIAMSLISYAKHTEGSGVLTIKIAPDLKPYLIALNGKHTPYTKYMLKNILKLKGSHSIRIYELLKQYENMYNKQRKFKLDELKELLGVSNEYQRFYDFEKYILKTAKKEIDKETDIQINYEKIKVGRKIDSIVFYIEPKQIDFEEETLKKYKENKIFDFEKVRESANLTKSKFSDKQILELYEIACEVTDRLNQIDYNVDVYKYMDFNYKYSRMNAKKSIFSFYKKSLQEDFANAKIAMMK